MVYDETVVVENASTMNTQTIAETSKTRLKFPRYTPEHDEVGEEARVVALVRGHDERHPVARRGHEQLPGVRDPARGVPPVVAPVRPHLAGGALEYLGGVE